MQKKFNRHGDPDSWHREYDLYASDLDTVFVDNCRWPKCYHLEMNDDEIQLWLEYIDGASGGNLTVHMNELAAEELGRLQGRLYAEQPAVLQNLSNLSEVNFQKNYYLRYKSWPVVYDYIRFDECKIPKHLCKMLIDIDSRADEIWSRIEKLPVVLCHRDFWVTNIFYSDDKIVLIDWDTTGWGYLGEDIAALIADDSDITLMAENYRRCIPAYYRGFSEYVDVSHITDNLIYEQILFIFGYRFIDFFVDSESPGDKALQIDSLQKIYEMGIDRLTS